MQFWNDITNLMTPSSKRTLLSTVAKVTYEEVHEFELRVKVVTDNSVAGRVPRLKGGRVDIIAMLPKQWWDGVTLGRYCSDGRETTTSELQTLSVDANDTILSKRI